MRAIKDTVKYLHAGLQTIENMRSTVEVEQESDTEFFIRLPGLGVSVLIDTEGTAKISEEKISRIVRKFFPLTPRKMIDHLNLARPIFAETSHGGHFGRTSPNFTRSLFLSFGMR